MSKETKAIQTLFNAIFRLLRSSVFRLPHIFTKALITPVSGFSQDGKSSFT